MVKQKFRKTKSRVIQTFDYIDLASGLAYQDFFLAISKNDTVLSHHMLDNVTISSVQDRNVATEVNFDTSVFNLPRTVSGTVYISGTVEPGGGGAPGAIVFQLIKVAVGGAETNLTSTVTTNPTITDNVPEYFMVALDITTDTIIKKGEKLRLEVDGGTEIYLGTSPTDLDGGTITPSSTDATTITKVSIPFKTRL